MIEKDEHIYGLSAEYYDITGMELWRKKVPIIRRLCNAFPKNSGPVLDIGAGTGNASIEIAKYMPDISVIALEPSDEMRIAFASKIANSTDLCSRITIVPQGISSYSFPSKVSGAVCLGVVGHLSSEERKMLWQSLRDSLAKGAPLLVEILDEALMKESYGSILAFVSVGEQQYEVSVKQQSKPEDRFGEWLFIYKVYHGDKVIREIRTPMRWERLCADEIRKELNEAGFISNELTKSILIARVSKE